MPISALVLTLDAPDSEAPLRVLLASLPGVEVGPGFESRLAITLDAADVESHAEMLANVERLPSVRFVDLVMHDFSDVDRAPRSLLESRRKGRLHGAP